VTDQLPSDDSSFITLGTDLNFNRQAPAFLQQPGKPGGLTAQFSARYTVNLDGDAQALNRTGLSLTAAAGLQTEIWELKAGATLYSYVDQGFSDRIWASINRRIAKDWWAGIEGAYTHRANGHESSGQTNEAAVLFTVRHDFELPVPWLARRGQATALVFRDTNNNGKQDPGEPGLPGIKVAVGSEQALTNRDGTVTLPAMAEGTYPINVMPPTDVHLTGSTASPLTTAKLRKGNITSLALGMIEPTTCEGKVTFEHETGPALSVAPNEQREDLDGLELICTDASGLVTRSGTRADGFFAGDGPGET
jgi:hypothetical protein